MATVKIPKGRFPTLKPLETRWNETEGCFEVDWEESVRRQAAESFAEAIRKHADSFMKEAYPRYVQHMYNSLWEK